MNIEIHSVQDFNDYLDEKLISGTSPFFRGHGKNEYTNLPTICRSDLGLSLEEILLYDQKILEKLKVEVDEYGFIGSVKLHPGFGTSGYFNDWLLLAQARHYGMPSRLQDWSMDRLIGLYFAVNNTDFHEEPGHVWLLRSPMRFATSTNPKFDTNLASRFLHINADEEDRAVLDTIDPFDIEKTTLIDLAHFSGYDESPQTFEERRWSQGGIFIISKNDLINSKLDRQFIGQLMTRVEIPAIAKKGILEELIKRGIHEKTILPPIPDDTTEILEGIKHSALMEIKEQRNH